MVYLTIYEKREILLHKNVEKFSIDLYYSFFLNNLPENCQFLVNIKLTL